jgi:hypothetical protein
MKHILFVSALVVFASSASAKEVCTQWNLNGTLNIHQSNGFVVELITTQRGNELKGTAKTGHVPKSGPLTGSDPVFQGGNFDGKVRNNEFQVTVYWSANSIGVYSGKINERGRIEGNTHDRLHPESTATWYVESTVSCAKTDTMLEDRSQGR